MDFKALERPEFGPYVVGLEAKLSTAQAEIERYKALLTPKDEAAERKHCEQVAMDICPPFEFGDKHRTFAADLLARSRTAAFAAGYTQGHEIAGESILECDRLRKQLSAATAEIERLKAALQDFESDTACEDRCEELETKLTNLRTADGAVEHMEALAALFDASEASR